MKDIQNRGKAGISILLAVTMLAGATLPVKVQAAERESYGQLPELKSVTDIKEYDNNELLVIYKENGPNIEELPESAKEEKITDSYAVIEVGTKKELRQAISVLGEDENIGYIQPNYAYRALYTDDVYSSSQWAYYGPYNIGMEEAWTKGTGVNEEVVVGIMDVGIDYNHEELTEAMWVNSGEVAADGLDNDGNGYVDDIYGYNFFDDNGIICDYAFSEVDQEYVEDHGTHIAGIIAAKADNIVGVAGIATNNNVKLMSLKVMGDKHDGYGVVGYSADIIKAIEYAAANGVKICNMSFGYTSYDMMLYGFMKNTDMLFVCAAGNGNETTGGTGWNIDTIPEYPAAFDLENIISVANMNSAGMIDYSSCYGKVSVDIAAPGTEIISTAVDDPVYNSDNYLMMTGTSMAAPMVTATAALTASYHGNLTVAEIKEAILNGASVNEGFNNAVAGNRMLNVAGALGYYEEPFTITTEITEVSEKSNNKRVHISVTDNASPVSLVAYAKGEQTKEYFESGVIGTLLEYDGTTAKFKATQTGIYTIYVLCEDGTESTAQVEVEVPVITKLKLSTKKKTLKKGKTYTLKATVKPSDMYVKVTYKSSNPKVATVNSKGKITAKKKGTAKITVIAKDGNTTKKATCTITVKN